MVQNSVMIPQESDYEGISLDYIYNSSTINIFSDASMDLVRKRGCYGSIAAIGDTIIDQGYYFLEDTTNNAAEINGIILSLSFALHYTKLYGTNNIHNINIFTDSLSSIQSVLKMSIYIAKYDGSTYRLYNPNGKVYVPNGDLVNTCIVLIEELFDLGVELNLYHQSAHILDEKYFNRKTIQEARRKFANINNLDQIPSTQYLLYISRFNNQIDTWTRNLLREAAYRDESYQFIIPERKIIRFLPTDTPSSYYDKRKEVHF